MSEGLMLVYLHLKGNNLYGPNGSKLENVIMAVVWFATSHIPILSEYTLKLRKNDTLDLKTRRL